MVWHLTPGHTKGCTTWEFDVQYQSQQRRVLLVCGFKILPFTKLGKHPEVIEDYKKSFDIIDELLDNCEILLAPHMSHFEVGETLRQLHTNEYEFQQDKCINFFSDETKKATKKITKY